MRPSVAALAAGLLLWGCDGDRAPSAHGEVPLVGLPARRARVQQLLEAIEVDAGPPPEPSISHHEARGKVSIVTYARPGGGQAAWLVSERETLALDHPKLPPGALKIRDDPTRALARADVDLHTFFVVRASEAGYSVAPIRCDGRVVIADTLCGPAARCGHQGRLLAVEEYEQVLTVQACMGAVNDILAAVSKASPSSNRLGARAAPGPAWGADLSCPKASEAARAAADARIGAELQRRARENNRDEDAREQGLANLGIAAEHGCLDASRRRSLVRVTSSVGLGDGVPYEGLWRLDGDTPVELLGTTPTSLVGIVGAGDLDGDGVPDALGWQRPRPAQDRRWVAMSAAWPNPIDIAVRNPKASGGVIVARLDPSGPADPAAPSALVVGARVVRVERGRPVDAAPGSYPALRHLLDGPKRTQRQREAVVATLGQTPEGWLADAPPCKNPVRRRWADALAEDLRHLGLRAARAADLAGEAAELSTCARP